MLNKMLKHTTKIISAFILTMIVFAFLHSEAGLLDFDGNNHGAHDYCEIVKTATTKITKDVSKDIFKLQVNKSVCFHCIDEINQNTSRLAVSVSDSEQSYIPQKTTDVYLFNRTFLI